jgi:hypothetical protein
LVVDHYIDDKKKQSSTTFNAFVFSCHELSKYLNSNCGKYPDRISKYVLKTA